MIGLLVSSRSERTQPNCYPCLRTSVTYVSGLYTDYIPAGDSEFHVWQQNFREQINTNWSNLGLDFDDSDATDDAASPWLAAYPAWLSAEGTSQVRTGQKADARTALEALIRDLVQRLQASPAVSDAERRALGITVADTKPTSVTAPRSRPVAIIDTSQRLQHAIAFADEGTPTKEAKPQGVRGCEIWVKLSWTPVDLTPDGLQFLALDSKPPYIANFNGDQGGMTAHYWLRWVNTRGEHGPWSETVSATIGV